MPHACNMRGIIFQKWGLKVAQGSLYSPIVEVYDDLCANIEVTHYMAFSVETICTELNIAINQ